MSSKPTMNDRYVLESSLGSGSTSQVFLANDTKTGKKVALKILNDSYIKKSGVRDTMGEVEILSALDHPNINGIIDSDTQGKLASSNCEAGHEKVFVALEYIPACLSFFDLVQSVGPMGEDGARFFMDQIVSAMKYCHDKYVIHRDIKLENIIVDRNLNIQLIDFGFATYKNIAHLNDYKGTQSYMAPEIRERKTYDGRKIDIFSIGVILNILMTGNFAFSKAESNDFFYNKLIEQRYTEYWIATKGFNLSADFKDLIQKMLHYDPKERISMKDLLKHPFMTRPYDREATRRSISHKFFGIAGALRLKKYRSLNVSRRAH